MREQNITDMTVGSPTKHLLRFSLPLLVGNLFQQFYNMVDSLVVGNYVGANALAAVGNCGSMNFLFFSLSLGLSLGVGVLISQYFGAKNEEKIRSVIANAIYILLSVSILVSVLGIVLAEPLLRLMGTPGTILGDSAIYLKVTCAGILGMTLYNGVSAVLRALGDSKTPLYFLIVSCVINIVLDLFFVLVCQWSVFGVALATIIAQAVSGITCMIYAYQKVAYFRLTKEVMKLDWNIIYRTFALGVPVALQNAMIAISGMVLQGVVNSFGEVAMAAYTIISRLGQMVQQPFSSLSMAITTYTGQNIGAGQIKRVEQGYRKSVVMVLIFSVCLIPIAYLFDHQIISIFVKDPEVVALGIQALHVNCLFYFPLGMIYVPRALMNGAGDSGFAMLNGVTEVACRIGYSQILTRIPALGYYSLWLTTGITWLTTAIVCVRRYKQGKWRTKSALS